MVERALRSRYPAGTDEQQDQEPATSTPTMYSCRANAGNSGRRAGGAAFFRVSFGHLLRSCRWGNGCFISDVGRGALRGRFPARRLGAIHQDGPRTGGSRSCCRTPVAPCGGTISSPASPGSWARRKPCRWPTRRGPRAHVIGNASDRPSGAGPPGGVGCVTSRRARARENLAPRWPYRPGFGSANFPRSPTFSCTESRHR